VALDAQARPLPHLRQLLTEPSGFERESIE
jgi:hypothetical protein